MTRPPLPPPTAAPAPAEPSHPWRWLVLPALFLGYLVTASEMGLREGEYLALTVVAACACALLLWRYRRVTAMTLPVWILLGAFLLGYFVKFYALVSLAKNPVPLTYAVFGFQRLALVSSPDVALEAFRMTVVGFCVFCAVFVLLPGVGRSNRGPHLSITRHEVEFLVRTATLAGLGLLVVTTALALVLNLFVAGSEAGGPELPFRLLGIIFYTRSVLLVALGLLVLQCGLVTRTPAWTRWGIGLVIGLALTDVVARSTRGSLVAAALSVAIMFWLVRERFDPAARRLFLVVFGAALLLFPVITQYRYALRMGGEAGMDMFLQALRQALGSGDAVSVFWSGAASVLARFIGVDSLLFITHPETWLGVDGFFAYQTGGGSVASYFTHQVVGVPLMQAHSEAPSLMGWFVLTGGWWGLTVGLTLYLVAGWTAWRWVARAPLLAKPVLQTQLLMLWLSLSSEGTIDFVLPRQLPPMVMTFILCELYLRAGVRRASRASGVPPSGPRPAPPLGGPRFGRAAPRW